MSLFYNRSPSDPRVSQRENQQKLSVNRNEVIQEIYEGNDDKIKMT